MNNRIVIYLDDDFFEKLKEAHSKSIVSSLGLSVFIKSALKYVIDNRRLDAKRIEKLFEILEKDAKNDLQS